MVGLTLTEGQGLDCDQCHSEATAVIPHPLVPPPDGRQSLLLCDWCLKEYRHQHNPGPTGSPYVDRLVTIAERYGAGGISKRQLQLDIANALRIDLSRVGAA